MTSGPFARILVGDLGSDQGADASVLAGDLAALCGAELLLMSVVVASGIERLHEQTGAAVVDGVERERAPVASSAAASDLVDAGGLEHVEARLGVSSSSARGLRDAAVSVRADLIVVGSSHRTQLGQVFARSVGERLLKRAPCAVAVAPRGYAHGHSPAASRRLGKIVVAFDGSPEARLALRTAHDLAARSGATLRVLTVVVPTAFSVVVGEVARTSGPGSLNPLDDDVQLDARYIPRAVGCQERAARSAIETALEALGGGIAVEQQVIVGPSPASVITGVVREGVDLLVLGSRGYGSIRHTLVGGVSTPLVRQAPCPMLITPRVAQSTSWLC